MKRMQKCQVKFLKLKCLLIPFGKWLLNMTIKEGKIPLVFPPFKVPLYHSCKVSSWGVWAGGLYRRHFKDGISCRNEAVWSQEGDTRVFFLIDSSCFSCQPPRIAFLDPPPLSEKEKKSRALDKLHIEWYPSAQYIHVL